MTSADVKKKSKSTKAAPEASAQPPVADTPQPLHPLQKLLDHPWWLLFLGIVIPSLSYTAWAWIELLLIKPAQLP